MATSAPYVLGTGDDELARLGLQHQLWSDAAHAAWRLARIGPKQSWLDVGCGPGYASFDLAHFVAHTGHVVAVDESIPFIDFARDQSRLRGQSNLTFAVADVTRLTECHEVQAHNLAVSAGFGSGLHSQYGGFDGAYIRWVLCFLKRPELVLRELAKLIKQGGQLVIHDYFNYTSMTMAPRRSAFDKAVAATAESWRERGGDPDIMAHIPTMLATAGFTVRHLNIHARIARGSSTGQPDSMYHWMANWWRTYAPKLVTMGRLTQADCDELLADIAQVERSDTDFVVCPTVYEIVAERV